jgi:hypothetical protein
LEPWYKVATARNEVREGRSFNPDEFDSTLEQRIAGIAPEDYRNPCHCGRARLAREPQSSIRRSALPGRTTPVCGAKWCPRLGGKYRGNPSASVSPARLARETPPYSKIY